jgi:hypothetical protein
MSEPNQTPGCVISQEGSRAVARRSGSNDEERLFFWRRLLITIERVDNTFAWGSIVRCASPAVLGR